MTMEAFGEENFGDDPRWQEPLEKQQGWLSEEELAESRGRVPILYVEALPVRVDHAGRVVEVGLRLRGSPVTGSINRTLVSGRVLHGERVRDALIRHLEKDLGPTAFPALPPSIVPAAVAEYFPWPGERLSDPRQHCVSLAYVVAVTGECQPRQDALELSWMTPEEAAEESVAGDLEGGRGALLRQLLHHAGAL